MEQGVLQCDAPELLLEGGVGKGALFSADVK